MKDSAMRNLILAGWICILLTGTVAAQQPVEPWANKLFGGATSKDFGTVAKGAQLKYNFKVTNIYKVPLEITNVRVTCGCVTVKDANGVDMTHHLKDAQRVIEPNESIYLHVNMDSRRFDGHKSINVMVTVGPQYISTATLTVQASTRQDVVLNPGEIDFGVVHRGNSPSQSFDVEYAGAAGWRLDEIVKNNTAPFDLQVEDLKGRVGKSGYRIKVTLKPEAGPGQFREEILLKTNNGVLTYTISGNVQAPLEVSHANVTFSSVQAGTEGVKVSVRGSRPFRIARIDGQGQGVTATFAADRLATMHVVTIRCVTEQPAELRKVLTIFSSLDNESVQITVEARGEK
jgi:Protein of unknown function (DUF1573)